jgi:hypothetical protein
LFIQVIYPCPTGLFYDAIGNEIGAEMALGEANKLNMAAAVAAVKASEEIVAQEAAAEQAQQQQQATEESSEENKEVVFQEEIKSKKIRGG